MAISAALSTGQQGTKPISGVAHMALFTITWDASSLVTGEPLDLTSYFSTIDAVIPAGCSAIGLAGYIPAFSFTAGGTHTAADLLAYLMLQDGAAGPMEPANAVDIAALGTTQIMVWGKAA